MKFKANIDRIMGDIVYITGGSVETNRPSYSIADAMTREFFLKAFEELDLSVSVDGAGNIRAAMAGREPGLTPVLAGSHIDTVKKGGRFDGLVGTIGALECVRVFKENDYIPRRGVEIIIFAEEEATNFGITLLGSKLLTGAIKPKELKEIYSDDGESADSIIRQAGFDPSSFNKKLLERGEVYAMIETHIEQGPRLDKQGVSIGAVERIAGMETYRVVFKGVCGHAGTTAMADRHDPMLGAAEVILEMKKIAESAESGTAVATVGKITARPGAANIIAGEVEFNVDIRDAYDMSITMMAGKLHMLVERIADKYGLTAESVRIAKSPAVALDREIVSMIQDVALELGVSCMRVNSGAVHDTGMMEAVTRAGMIFVPSIAGASHCPEEETRETDISNGVNVLIETVRRLAEE